MSRILMLIVLMLIASSAWAEWTWVGESEGKGGHQIYLDFSTIRRSGNLVKVWELYDYKIKQTVSGASFLSAKIQRQYDCQEEQLRVLAYSAFSKNMGEGDLVHSESGLSKWLPVEPQSVGYRILKIVCGKK